MSSYIAGIDVHKRMLAVVIANVEDAYQFERQKVGTSPADLRALAAWHVERDVEEVVMESTAQDVIHGDTARFRHRELPAVLFVSREHGCCCSSRSRPGREVHGNTAHC